MGDTLCCVHDRVHARWLKPRCKLCKRIMATPPICVYCLEPVFPQHLFMRGTSVSRHHANVPRLYHLQCWHECLPRPLSPPHARSRSWYALLQSIRSEREASERRGMSAQDALWRRQQWNREAEERRAMGDSDYRRMAERVRERSRSR